MTLDLQVVLGVILDSVARFFPRAAAIGIALRAHGASALEPVACRGMVLLEWKNAFFETGGSFIKAGALDAPLVIANLRTDPHLPVRLKLFDLTRYSAFSGSPLPRCPRHYWAYILARVWRG